MLTPMRMNNPLPRPGRTSSSVRFAPCLGVGAGLIALVLGAGSLLAAMSSTAAADELVLNPIADSTLISDDPNFALGSGPIFFGTTAGGIRRTLLRFDLSGLPANAQIDTAILRIVVDRAGAGSGAQTASVHRLTASWGEGTASSTGGGGDQASATDSTWEYRFYGAPPQLPRRPWTALGGDFAPAASATTVLGANGPVLWQSTAALVADVGYWVSQPQANFGWVIVGPENDLEPKTVRRALSREAVDPASRPTLTVTYTLATAATTRVPAMPALAICALAVILAGGVARRLRARSLSRHR